MTTRIRPKHALDILRARIAEACVVTGKFNSVGMQSVAVVTIPLWVAEELKQALEKQ